MNSFLTGLGCSRCGTSYSAEIPQNLCSCGSPLLAQYDLSLASKIISRHDFGSRVHSLWRYRELLPVRNPEYAISLNEGFTPLMPSIHIGKILGMEQLRFKDESMNPTGTFKARGLCLAVSKAKELGVREISLPTAGNAGGAAAAYAARAGLKCNVFMPRDTPPLFVNECLAYGAKVELVDGFITDAGSRMRSEMKDKDWFDVSTLKEPYRVEGKKTILYELAQQFNWNLPDVILFPTGGGTGIIGAWKACQELKELGWIDRFKMPRLIAVQAAGCAPMVRAFQEGLDHAPEWENPVTAASGLRVPKAVGDFLILRAIRDSQGTAVAVDEEAIVEASTELSTTEGMFVAPEAAASLAALKQLLSSGLVDNKENVVLLFTGCGLKYVRA
jgi:threonine synthase